MHGRHADFKFSVVRLTGDSKGTCSHIIPDQLMDAKPHTLSSESLLRQTVTGITTGKCTKPSYFSTQERGTAHDNAADMACIRAAHFDRQDFGAVHLPDDSPAEESNSSTSTA